MHYKFHDEELEALAKIAHDLGAQMSLTYLPATTANSMLGTITTTGLFLGLNNSTGPGTTGANEVPYNSASGYTQTVRPAIAWAAASSGVVVSNDTQTFTMGGSWSTGAIGYFSLWTASTAGTYLGGGTITGLSSVASGATVTITSAVTLTVAG